MAFKKENYPPDWPEIREEILKRAEYRCECAGECNSEKCFRHEGRCTRLTGGKTVLTIAHLCHTQKCDKREHLKAMCQGCHLAYDLQLHRYVRRKNRDRAVGQQRMFLSFD